MELPAQPNHLQMWMEQAQQRAEVIRQRMAWVEERRRELWRRMDGLEGTPARVRRAEALEIDPVTVYPLV
jgi:hypothetical protein